MSRPSRIEFTQVVNAIREGDYPEHLRETARLLHDQSYTAGGFHILCRTGEIPALIERYKNHTL